MGPIVIGFGLDPHSVTPVTDGLLWVRWLVAVVVVWWLPGRLLLREPPSGWPAVIVLYLRLAAGFLWVVVIGLALRWLGWGLHPSVYVLLSPVLAWGAGRFAAGSSGPAGAPASRAWWLVAVACLGLFAAMVEGFARMSAPPHVHDASNHAWMVARAAETGGLDPVRIFAEFVPRKLYFAGWHLVAAITGSFAGIAPYVAAWFTAITCAVLTPLALAALWWRWGFAVAPVVVGTFWLMTNAELPAGNPFSWGGFGVIAAFFVVPLTTILLAQTWRTRGRLLALAAGLALAATAHVHFSEVLVIPFLALLTVVLQRRAETPVAGPAGNGALAAVLFVVGLALAFEPSMAAQATTYASDIGALRSQVDTVGLERALRSFPESIGPPDLRFPWAVGGTLALLFVRRWRPVAIASLLLGLWVFALKYWHDPISGALATPFYGQATRLYYQQIYLVPLAAGAGTVMLARWAGRRGRVPAGLVVIVAAVTMVLGFAKHHPNLADLDHSVPFDRDEYALALRIAEVVGPDEVVANYRDDGSTWAAQVSGCRFLNPLSWGCTAPDGTDLMAAAAGLREDPWPAATRSLEDRGVRWLYVSAHRLEYGHLFTPAEFEDDPRFSVALEQGGSRLLQIHWDRAMP